MKIFEDSRISQHLHRRLTSGDIKVRGIPVKCISSNVRYLDIPWDAVQLISGRGHEGNLILVEVLTGFGSRKYLENQQGVNQML